MNSGRDIQWTVHGPGELSAELLHDILRLRVDVFVVEQQCAYAEVDGQDLAALHIVARDGGGTLAAYARILPGVGGGLPHIGRVVVRKEHRGRGLGKELMQAAFNALRLRYGSARSAVAAQVYLLPFYAGLGYIRMGPDYLWDGIPHVDMQRDAD